jgi:hypothetical protein
MAPSVLKDARVIANAFTTTWPVAANRSRRRATFFHLRTRSTAHLYMKSDSTNTGEQEPIGIVISRGAHQEHVPTFIAYMWAPDPETSEEAEAPKAA